jgi:hypothetical protein
MTSQRRRALEAIAMQSAWIFEIPQMVVPILMCFLSICCYKLAPAALFVIGFFCTMSGSEDCPQLVSTIHSAAQSLLAAKTISNEGLHFNCPFAAMFLAITLYTHMYYFLQISKKLSRFSKMRTCCFPPQMTESPAFQRKTGKIGSKYSRRCQQFFANYVHCSFFRRFSIMQTFLFPSILTSSYFCVLIELAEACFLEMKTECLLFTESWTFVANALLSSKNVSLQKYPSLLSLCAYRLKCRRKSTSH